MDLPRSEGPDGQPQKWSLEASSDPVGAHRRHARLHQAWRHHQGAMPSSARRLARCLLGFVKATMGRSRTGTPTTSDSDRAHSRTGPYRRWRSQRRRRPRLQIYLLRSSAGRRPQAAPGAPHARDDGVAGVAPCRAATPATVGKTVREWSEGGGGDSPLTTGPRSYRHDVPTVGRIKSTAAVIVSTRADEPFFRGDDRSEVPAHRRRSKVHR